MINELKMELIRQIDNWSKCIERMSDNSREANLFYMEKLNLTNSTITNVEVLIRKYEQLKYIYQDILKRQKNASKQSQYFDDTFNTLYNKYMTKKQKPPSMPANKVNKSTTKVEQDSKSYQLQQQEQFEEINEIEDQYKDELNYYQQKVKNIAEKLRQHQHLNLQQNIQIAMEQNEQIRKEYRELKEQNTKLREDMIVNRSKVEELRNIQLQIIDELNQYT